MPQHSTRGFQTNGKLLTKDRIISLIRSGINKICISIDTIQPEKFDSIRSGGMLSDIDETFNAIRNSKHQLPESQLTVGIEFVLMKKNIDELPFVIDWASKNNVDFIIVSHLTAYEKEIEEQSVFLNNSYEVLDLFNIYRKKAAQKDLDISDYYKIRWKFSKSEREYELYNLVADLKEKALKQNLYINLFHLLNEVPEQYNRIKTVFDDAKTKAKAYGISLDLPRIRPKTQRECKFMEENTVFITWDGYVAPCYFLYHQYETLRNGYTKKVESKYFGNVMETSPVEIWNMEEFKRFRSKAKSYDYPNCHAWCEIRCDYVLDEPFNHDCFINDVPCCDCYWSLGFLNCLT
jgi:putative metalloenzyme radical SAM/SPASM domain maturase